MVKIIALMELATDCHTSDGIFEGPDSIISVLAYLQILYIYIYITLHHEIYIYIYKICRYANTDIIESGPTNIPSEV